MKELILALTILSLAGLALSETSVTADVPARGDTMDVQISRTHVDTPAGVEYNWPSGTAVPVVRKFQPGPANWNSGHRGVDLALADGTPVFAAAEGTVIYSGLLNDRELVSIEHPDGIRTTYEPIIPEVIRGQTVERGEMIGFVTGTHCYPLSCLHWGAKRGSADYLDPLSLLDRQPIRLYE